jgi:hypothetical protein
MRVCGRALPPIIGRMLVTNSVKLDSDSEPGTPLPVESSSHIEDREFSLLLQQYQSLMEGEKSYYSTVGTIIAVGTSFAGLFGAVLTLNYSRLDHQLRQIIWAFLPLVPLILLSYLILLSMFGIIRGPYLRAIEKEIRVRVPLELTLSNRSGLPRGSSTHVKVRVPSEHRLMLPVVSPETGPLLTRFSILFIAPLVLAIIFVLAISVTAFVHLAVGFWWFAVGGYSIALLAIGRSGLTAVIGSHRFWHRLWRSIHGLTPETQPSSNDSGNRLTRRWRNRKTRRAKRALETPLICPK